MNDNSYKELFSITNADTDSVSFQKKDGTPFSEEEQLGILAEINSFLEEGILMEDDGYFEKFVVVKAKNYVMKEDGKDKIKYKGSSFKDAKKEPALKEFMFSVIEDCLIHEIDTPESVYERYVQEALNIQDISRWCVKKSITENLLLGNDTAKKKVLTAIEGKDVSVGDKVFLYNVIDGERQAVVKGELKFLKSGKPKMIPNDILRVSDSFDGDYDKKHYLKRLYNTAKILKGVIDMDKIVNYSLAKNFKLVVPDES